MAFCRQLSHGATLLALVAMLLGGIWAYPRVPWMGELPSRLEIAGENLLATLAGDRSYPIPAGAAAGGGAPADAVARREEARKETLEEALEEAMSRQAKWLLACRTASGTFAVFPGADLIIPYFANQAAWSLLPEYPQEVKAHLEWYLGHLNRPDRWGLTGTVYDYRIEGDREVSTGSYDSADAYAATFLTAVARYWQATGDTPFVQEHRAELDLVAGVIVALQDRDGLAWARPGHWVKYLMDNAENFQGLRDYAWLLERLGDEDAARYWAARAEAVRAGIRQFMYNPRRGEYYWALKMSGTRRLPNWRQWYPDAVAQLFPVLCGVESPDSDVSRTIYQRFASFYPGWASVPRPGRSPWGVLTPVAVTMGDAGPLQHLAAEPELPWHAGEAAYLLAAARMWLSSVAGSAGSVRPGVAPAPGGN